MHSYPSTLDGSGLNIAIVTSRFNESVTSKLYETTVEGLLQHGVEENSIHDAWVPGAYELPIIAKKLAESGRYDAVITLGTVIRGETAHFEHVATQAAEGITRASLDTGVPIIFGVLTTYTQEQAMERAGPHNIGLEWARAAIEMANLVERIEGAKVEI